VDDMTKFFFTAENAKTRKEYFYDIELGVSPAHNYPKRNMRDAARRHLRLKFFSE